MGGSSFSSRLALAKVWTWIGQFFLPIAISWATYVRGGWSGAHEMDGVLISRGYWGLLGTLLVGACLIWIAALYVREAKAKESSTLVPPNTLFEDERTRNEVISWGTVVVFGLALVGALALFGARYADSRIYFWTRESALDTGFWSSREAAHTLGCEHSPCFALGQRMYSTGPIAGVNEYVLYVTDGALVFCTLLLLSGIVFLVTSCFKARPQPDFER